MSNHNKEIEARCPHCYRHYVEGTAAWALYMMRMGRKVTNPKYDPRVYHLPEGGMIHINGVETIAGNLWIDYWCIDIPDGWEIYEEPQPLLADAKVGDLVRLRNGSYSQIVEVEGTSVFKYQNPEVVGDVVALFWCDENGDTTRWGKIKDADIVYTEPMQTTVRKLLAAIEEERKKQ